MDEQEIKELTGGEADNLFNSENSGKYEPTGLFYEETNDMEGKILYLGIDNSTGDCWTEEFYSLEKCKKWLKGEVNHDGN